MSSAIVRTASLPAGIQDGFGRAVALLRGDVALAARTGSACVYVVIELSRVCMTSAITVRSDQCFRSYRLASRAAARHISRSQVRQRGSSPSPSVSTDCSSDIALVPGP